MKKFLYLALGLVIGLSGVWAATAYISAPPL